MSYEQIQDLKERIEKVPNQLISQGDVPARTRYVPNMAALGGEVHKIARGAVANGD